MTKVRYKYKAYQIRAIKIAKQLRYGDDVIQAISEATTEYKISLILSRARNK